MNGGGEYQAYGLGAAMESVPMTTRYLDWPNNLTRSELVNLLRSYATEALDIEHILGQALGMPIDHDGEVGPAGVPDIGKHTALTLAVAAAKRLGELDQQTGAS